MTVKRHLPHQWKYTPCSLPLTALVDEYGIGIPAKVRSLVVAEKRGMAIPPGVCRVDCWNIAPPKRRYVCLFAMACKVALFEFLPVPAHDVFVMVVAC